MKQVVEIFDISYEGAGVGKLDGQIVFVPKALPNEIVEVEIVKKTNKFLIGKLLRVLQASERRIEAFCPYFNHCGGCDFQHCDQEQEKKLKLEILKRELTKAQFFGKIDFVSSPKRFFYRNKIKFEIKEDKLGYFEAKSKNFVAVENCPIASENINKTLPLIKAFIKENHFKNLCSLYVKDVSQQVAICFLFEKNSEKSQKNIKNLEIFEGFSVFFAFGDILESNETKVFCVYGKSYLNLQLDQFSKLSMQLDVSAFNQVNDEVAEKLYDFVCELTQNKRVVNAYSGQGYLTFLIGKNAKFVYGIEYQKVAHEAAEKFLKQIKEFRFENICGKVEYILPNILLKDKIDCVVLDPAREGCVKEVLQTILSSQIETVIYVACNFASLVRDLKLLNEKYMIETVKIFDMFPCTANMETVAVLRRK